MAIYKMLADNGQKRIAPLSRKEFAEIGLREREDLQASLVHRIEAISPDTLIISEEFRLATWKDSNLRIDLLGIDKNADIVVIELKRTKEAGYAELQAIRYAALVATLTFEKVTEIYEDFLKLGNHEQANEYTDNKEEEDTNPKQQILDFLGWDEASEDDFAQNTRIVLASADFSQELTTSVMWLNDSGLDIRCVRLQPYVHDSDVLLDIQAIIPLPEASDYQVAQKEKRQSVHNARERKRDYTKYDMTIAGKNFSLLGARDIVRTLIKWVNLDEHIDAEALGKIIPHQRFIGESLTRPEIEDQIRNSKPSEPKRYFLEGEEILRWNGNTYVFWNNWKTTSAVEIAEKFRNRFPSLSIEIAESSRVI